MPGVAGRRAVDAQRRAGAPRRAGGAGRAPACRTGTPAPARPNGRSFRVDWMRVSTILGCPQDLKIDTIGKKSHERAGGGLPAGPVCALPAAARLRGAVIAFVAQRAPATIRALDVRMAGVPQERVEAALRRLPARSGCACGDIRQCISDPARAARRTGGGPGGHGGRRRALLRAPRCARCGRAA